MGFKRFSLLLFIRTVLVMSTSLLLTLSLTATGYHATSILLIIVLLMQIFELFNFVNKTNNELVRFFDAARYADFSQRFELKSVGSGFDELGNAFSDILAGMQAVRSQQQQELKHLKLVVEHVPVPLISIHQDQKITLWNNAARRLFGANPINKVSDLAQFSNEFVNKITTIQPGERQLVSIDIDGMTHQLSLSATQIMLAQQQEMLVSMQDIQTELGVAQLQAWQDLVRVLTHEIMNSITPVASLAKVAVDLVEDAKAKADNLQQEFEELDDVCDAVTTVARRSDSLMQFVSSYRQLTRLPPPNKKQLTISKLFKQVELLVSANWLNPKVNFVTEITPAELDVTVDADMIEQVIINLVKNADQALVGVESPQISLAAKLNKRGHVVIEVADNGMGIAEEVAAKIFVPFFTTKKDGSGVGLALTRQVMSAHGGHVKLSNSDSGATFSLTF